MAEKRLEVELLVCPEPQCRNISKLPRGVTRDWKGSCVGPMTDGHRKRKMVPVKFREIR